jgi:hypothetical protein
MVYTDLVIRGLPLSHGVCASQLRQRRRCMRASGQNCGVVISSHLPDALWYL